MQKLEADTASSETKQPEFLRWDENQCKAGLARLEQLQDELDQLRLSIPTIIQALTGARTSHQQHFNRFKRIVETEYSRVGHFRTAWQSEPVTEALEYAQQSDKRDPDLSKGATIQTYGWIEEAGHLLADNDAGETPSKNQNDKVDQKT